MLTDREPRIISSADEQPGAAAAAARRRHRRRRRRAPAGRHARSSASPPPAGAPARRPTQLDGDVLARLRGVGDQATTALQKARLLATVQPPGHARRPHRPAEPGALPRPAGRTAARRPPRAPTSASCSATSTGSSRSTTPSATRPATSCCGRWRRGCAAAVRPGRHGRPAQRRRVRDHPAGPGRPRGRAQPRRPGRRLLRRALPARRHRGRGRHQRRRRRARPRLRPHRRAAAPRGRRRDVPAQAEQRPPAARVPLSPRAAAQSAQAGPQRGLLVGAEAVRLQPAERPAVPLVEQREHPVHRLRARRVAGDVAAGPCPRRRSVTRPASRPARR